MQYRFGTTHETQRILEQAKAELESQGVRPGTTREMGLPGNVIVQGSAACDVTVLGAQGHGEHSEAGLGPLEGARDQLQPFHPGVDIEPAEGLPTDEILSGTEKRDRDFVVISATAMTDWKHQLLGRVSYKIAQDASCSVPVVKAHD
jgi:nucleotide-binding universal stress UspA family protein